MRVVQECSFNLLLDKCPLVLTNQLKPPTPHDLKSLLGVQATSSRYDRVCSCDYGVNQLPLWELYAIQSSQNLRARER